MDVEDVDKIYRPILREISSMMGRYCKAESCTCIFKEHEGIKVYVNEEGDYFSIDILETNTEFTINYDKNCTITVSDKENLYEDRIEILIIDALEATANHIKEIVHEDAISYEEIIEKLFQNLLDRRNLEVSSYTKFEQPSKLYNNTKKKKYI